MLAPFRALPPTSVLYACQGVTPSEILLGLLLFFEVFRCSLLSLGSGIAGFCRRVPILTRGGTWLFLVPFFLRLFSCFKGALFDGVQHFLRRAFYQMAGINMLGSPPFNGSLGLYIHLAPFAPGQCTSLLSFQPVGPLPAFVTNML